MFAAQTFDSSLDCGLPGLPLLLNLFMYPTECATGLTSKHFWGRHTTLFNSSDCGCPAFCRLDQSKASQGSFGSFTMTKLDYVRQEVDRSREFFATKRNENRAWVLWLSVTSVSLSALATVAIGATKMLSLEWLQVVALLATSIATVVGVWESVFAYRKLWNLNNVAMADLDRLRRLIDYRISDGTPVVDIEADKFFEEFNRILTSIDRAWIETYASK